jgi:hypothetical protein
MKKDAVIRITKPAYEAIVMLAKSNGKTVMATASDAILSAKNDADIERKKLRNELAEFREAIRRNATRKDLAALFYTLSKNEEIDVRKERLALGYRMFLGHEIHVDFASVSIQHASGRSIKASQKKANKLPKLWPKLLLRSLKNSAQKQIEEEEF